MIQWASAGIFLLVFWLMPGKKHTAPDSLIVAGVASSACDLIVDAGPDTNVCAPGGTIGLMGSITGSTIFYQWTPATGLSNPLILNPNANITGPITYTLVGWAVDPASPNLVVNGNFEDGNTGFQSDYTYVPDIAGVQNEMFPEGTYTVINNPNLVHTGFAACMDHTPGGDDMMVINGAASLQDIWCQTITITPNTFYNVSAWVASVNSASPAILRFSINDVPLGNTVNAPSNTCVWVPFNATWNSGSNTTAEICILNLNTALGGNDFALDDISMVSLCFVEDEVEITLVDEDAPEPDISGPTFLCEGETGIYTADFPPDPPILFYEWTVPSGAVIISGQGTPQVTVLWEDAQEGSVCLMIETRCDMNENCFEVTVGTEPDLPLISGPNTLCPSEIITLYTPELNPEDSYDWIVPPEVIIINGDNTNEIDIQWASPGEAEICVEVTNACGTTDNCTFLTLYPEYLTLFDTLLCTGTTIVINGNIYGNGIWTGIETFTSINGCDSIVEIEITEATTLEFMITANLCPGDSIFAQGAFQTQDGIYIDSFTTITNCDSIVFTEVIITLFDTTWIIANTCNPAEAGTTITTYSQGNCDSTVISQVLLVPSDTTRISLFSCAESDTGVVEQLLINQAGCDSLVITTTYLLTSDTTSFFLTTCDPSQVGILTDTLSNVSGCDSIVIFTTSFLESDTTILTLRTCMYADTGTTSTLLVNAEGCDSLVITNTLYAGSDTTFLSGYTCSPADSGIVILNLLNQFGCDSVVSNQTVLLSSDTTYLITTSCEPQDTGVTQQLLANVAGCDSLVVTTTTLLPPDVCHIEAVITVQQPLCYGDSAIVRIDIQVGQGPFNLTWVHQDFVGDFVYPTTGMFSFSFDVEGETYIVLSSANGLSFLDTIFVNAPPLLDVDAEITTDFNGYGVKCNGDKNGAIDLNILSSGTPPLSFEWSNGSLNQNLININAGLYQVTVTDQNGCVTTSSVLLTEPLPVQYDFTFEHIKCFGENNGSATISNLQGGVGPWTTSLDGKPFQNNLIYQNLNAGNHLLTLMDQNGCSFDNPFTLIEPEYWAVDLGPDINVPFGSTIELKADIQGQAALPFEISWSDNQCDDCIKRMIEILSNATFDVMVTDQNGCESGDAIYVSVFIDRDVFIPNIFSPNDDQINDLFEISSGVGVKELEELTIFDRWGNLVFQKSNFPPNDPSYAWDGRMNEKHLNPGVFVYKLIIVFKDQRKEIRFGDVTLMR
jgi:gliding motility-associated-like protein